MNAAKEATAEQDRLNEHLFTLATSPSSGKELRIFGLGKEFVARRRAAWRTVSTAVARIQFGRDFCGPQAGFPAVGYPALSVTRWDRRIAARRLRATFCW